MVSELGDEYALVTKPDDAGALGGHGSGGSSVGRNGLSGGGDDACGWSWRGFAPEVHGPDGYGLSTSMGMGVMV